MSSVQHDILELSQSINSLGSTVEEDLTGIKSSTRMIQSTTNNLYNAIVHFKTTMEQNEQIQIAIERLHQIDQTLKAKFSNREEIRRTIMGVVRDFDINLVRNITIQHQSEELWISNSRYWLASALIAISFWANDRPEEARTALKDSSQKDAIKTSLFFCLMNLRFGRIAPAKKWFYTYFSTLDPSKLQEETAILLQAFINGIFGKDTELEWQIVTLINKWGSVINEDEQISAELLNAYETYINNLNPLVTFSYPSIQNFCANSVELEHCHREVTKYEVLLQFVKSLDVEADPQSNENYKKRVDTILMDLIKNYDADEQEIRDQKKHFQAIIDNKGNMKLARAQINAAQDLEKSKSDKSKFNIGKQMIGWAIYDNNSQTNVHVRKFGLQNTKFWFKRAVGNFDIKLQESYPIEYSLKIDTWRSVSNGTDFIDQHDSINNHFNNNKFQNMFINFPNVAVFILLIISASLAFLTPFSLIFTALTGAFLLYRTIKAIRNYPARIRTATDHLQAVMDEIAEFRRYYEEQREKMKELLNTVDFL